MSSFDGTFASIAEETLDDVHGGANPGYRPEDNGMGRAGPGKSWSWLGNYYTPEALAHDQDVRSRLDRGQSAFQAHLGALPGLPSAIGSWFRAKFAPGPDDRQIG